MLEFNIAPNTQVGRIVIPEKVYQNENVYKTDEDKYSRGGEFVENLVTDNIIEYCKRWFHLAGFTEFLEDLNEFYEYRGFGKFSNLAKAGFIESPIIPINDVVESPIEFVDSIVESPIYFVNERPKELNYESLSMKGLE